MTDKQDFHPQLLPVGLGDLLPPSAALEESLLRKIADYLTACGYARVKPPLLEFATVEAGDATSAKGGAFRVSDPLSPDGRLMALRTDMTTQTARIATERLRGSPRPLRLFYSGEVLRVKGSQLRPERQFLQIGGEIIGTKTNVMATREVLLLAAESLKRALGKGNAWGDKISFDLSLPLLVGELLADSHAEVRESLTAALQVRDSAYLRRHDFKHAALLAQLTEAGGEYDTAIRALDKVKWTKTAKPLYQRLKNIASAVKAEMPEIRLTVDIVENQGFDYQSGVSFTVYAKGAKGAPRGALGRGGEYPANGGEAACGFSLYMDSLLRIAELKTVAKAANKRILAARGTGFAELQAHRKAGAVAVADWHAEKAADLKKRAIEQGYSHILAGGKITPVKW